MSRFDAVAVALVTVLCCAMTAFLVFAIIMEQHRPNPAAYVGGVTMKWKE